MVSSWQEQLPPVRGRYHPNVALRDCTWFRVGGMADILYRPADEEDLAFFLTHKPPDIPVHIIGAGSNVLVRDGGIPGIVLRLNRGFSHIRLEGEKIYAGAGCLDRTVSFTCRDHGIGGLEFLAGIPGTIGGAIRMNAGAYGREIKDILVYADVLDPFGKFHRLTAQDLGMTYRHTTLPEGWIVTSAVLQGFTQNPSVTGKIIEEILKEREATQPIKGRTGGSTFKNPEPDKAWKLIDEAECRGLARGDAQISFKHCNFLLNLGQATANDLESLAETVKQRVYDKSNISLQWEIVRMGLLEIKQ